MLLLWAKCDKCERARQALDPRRGADNLGVLLCCWADVGGVARPRRKRGGKVRRGL